MSLQLRHRHRRRPDIQNHNLVTIHQNRRHVPQILLVPRQSQLRTLVDDRRVLLISQIKNPHRTYQDGSSYTSTKILFPLDSFALTHRYTWSLESINSRQKLFFLFFLFFFSFKKISLEEHFVGIYIYIYI